MTPSLSRAAALKSPHLWTWLAVFFSLVVCATLSHLSFEESQTLSEAASTIRNIGQARVDLNEGFLHLTLADDRKTPFRKEEGLALIDQALATLQRAEAEGIAEHPFVLNEGLSWGDFKKTVETFRSELDEWNRAQGKDRAAIALHMRLAFHDLEYYASRIDNAGEVKLREINARLDRTFLTFIGISTLLLCGICIGVYRAGRAQRMAVLAMHRSEERLRVLGDSLPDGYIYQFVRKEDGTAGFTYISAGVERVHGIKAADCLRDAAHLISLTNSDQQAAYAAVEAESARNLADFEIDLVFRRPDGEKRIVHIRSHPIRRGMDIVWDGLVLDVTEHRRAEARIRKNEELLQHMGRTAKVGGWEFDAATGMGEWTEEIARIHDVDLSLEPSKELGLSFYTGASGQQIQAAVQAAIEQGTGYDLELEMVSAKGKHKWVRTIGVPVMENGKVARVRGSLQDITGLKLAESALREREHQLRLFVEHSPAALAMLDAEMHHLVVSRRWLTDFNLKESDVIGHSHYEVFPDIPERWKEVHRRCLAGATEKSEADQFVRANGTVDWVRWEIVPWRREDQSIGGLLLVAEVITRQKEAEEALRRQEQNYREIFNAVNDAIFVHDAVTGQVLDVNDAMLRMFGFASKEEFLSGVPKGSIMTELPYDWEEARRRIQLAVTHGSQVFDWLTHRKSGEPFWVEVSLHSAQIDGQNRVLASVRDISVRKWHELEIERLTRLYSTLSAVNQMIVRCQSRDDLFDEICRILVEFGKFRAVWVGLREGDSTALNVVTHRFANAGEPAQGWKHDCKMIRELLDNDRPAICNNPQPPCKECWRKSLPGQGIQSCATFPLRLGDRMIGAVSLFSGEPSFFNAEEVRLLNEIADDASFALDRIEEQAQQSLVQAERTRLTAAMEQAAELIVITDVKGQILYVNPAFEKVTGFTRAEALGRNPRILKSGKQDRMFYHALWGTLVRGKVWHGRFINKKKNGELYEEDATISPIRNGEGDIVSYVAVKRDVTHEMELEAQFRQSQKMEGIGQLAGGVAHDFNNILAAIMLQAQLSENAPGVPPEAAEGMQLIQQSCERGANLTRQLLLFSRKQAMQPRDLDLNEIVTNITKMLQRIIGENIRMQLMLHARPLITRVDAGMLDQVILNLAINGRDAMGGQGRLTIETSEKVVDAENLPTPDAAPGVYACLAIGDNGCGIPPEILPRIFEPFFTTKEQGKGTGLGLATVFGIVRQHNGWIQVHSEQGKGTTFEVFLPRRQTAPQAEAARKMAVETLRGTETILLAEDDFDVRKITRKLLELHGYRVLEARNGVEALALWKKHDEKVDLLLTDLLMPYGINGHDLAQRIHAVNPGLKVIYLSGYSADLDGRGLTLRPGENFLQKPAMPDQLLTLVRRQLQQREA